MAENFISSIQIQKLGHKIPEIRVRTLFSIISKLDHGFLYDNDLARSKEIVTKLLEWFSFEPISNESIVLTLIKRIFQSESGKTLLNHYGTKDDIAKLKQIRTYIQPKYQHQVEEILTILNEYKRDVVVPPLETDIPLSYRTGQSELSSRIIVESTATPIEGLVYKDSSAVQQTRLPSYTTPLSTKVESIDHKCKCLPNYTLPWQMLIETDRHVLQSVENSFKNPLKSSALLYSCDFFNDVLLHDFPAEIFIQRSTIVAIFHDLLLMCTSNRLINEVLNCLNNLTIALKVRINHYNDPRMHNLEGNVLLQVNSANSSPSSVNLLTVDEEFGRIENVIDLKKKQMPFPYFCLTTTKCIFKYLSGIPENVRQSKRKISQTGINTALIALDHLSGLLSLVLKKEIWYETPNVTILNIIKVLNEMMIEFGDVLEYFRVEVRSNETNTIYRVIQLCLLNNCSIFLINTIPLSQTGLVLPRSLKNALSNSLIDVTFARLYPKIHSILLEYVETFSIGLTTTDSLHKYKETNKICNSMRAAVRFLQSYKSLNGFEAIQLAEKAVSSLAFHENLSFIAYFIDLCANKIPLYPNDDDILNTSESVILKLLSHNTMEIKEETYRLCHKRVVAAVGPKLNVSRTGVPGSQVLFLITPKILMEIALYGITSSNIQIEKYSEDILIHLIKSKILVSEDNWNKIVTALLPTFPIILCHSGNKSCLGRTLINIVDPDTAQTMLLPTIEVVKGNVQLLFCKDALVRDEGFSRLCWLMAIQKNSKDMLPRLNNLHDKALPNVCQLKRILDVNKTRNLQHYYQPSNLQQVIEVLKSSNVEPMIRRSALTQASVMIEDPLLHAIFLDSDGLNIVLEIMKKAMIEHDYQNYPDSIIPVISILKNICLFHSSGRQELCGNIEVYFCILRGLFMFFTEERLRQDASSLLFLLIFNNYLRGSPMKDDFSIPDLVCQKLNTPFTCCNHWTISQYTEDDLKTLLSSDKLCLSSLQIEWNSEILGGFNELLCYDEIKYDEWKEMYVPDLLKLKNYDLQSLKFSAIEFSVKKYLNDIQNGTTHESVIDAINYLTLYVHLYQISKNKTTSKEDTFLALPWENTFSRFFKTLPSSDEDLKLVTSVVKFLKFLVPLYKSSDKSFWLGHLLNNSTDCFLDLLSVDTRNDDYKVLNQHLLTLFATFASQDQHYLDYYTDNCTKISKTEMKWIKLIRVIAENLKFSDTEHFYNLAYLDSLLSCLVYLTANLEWSESKPNIPPKEILSQMISNLCELIVVFHSGKGSTATVSVMGLSITRNALLILNHLIAEMQNSQVKEWDICFLEMNDYNWFKTFLDLWSSRDVVLRAAVLQLFCGLTQSSRLAIEIVNEAKNIEMSVWDMALQILLDHEGASIVRENAANLLANLVGHTTVNSNNKITLLPSVAPSYLKTKEVNDVPSILIDLLESYQFYKHFETILHCLYTIHMIDSNPKVGKLLSDEDLPYSDKFSDVDVESSTKIFIVTTPGLVRNVTIFLNNILSLEVDKFSSKLQEYGLVKLLFRCICNPTMSINDTKKLSVYCDILEMNTTICSFLIRVTRNSYTCLGTVLYTKDCLNMMISLLNPKCYYTHFPQLLYLRNKLWSEVFGLIATLVKFDTDLNTQSVEAFKIIFEILEEIGRQPFLETLCEAISSISSNFLQNAAILSLTSLLRVESQKYTSKVSIIETSSMQNILDTVRTPRTIPIEDVGSENEENIAPNEYQMSILRDVYFVDKIQKSKTFLMNNTEYNLMAGGEICKILLHLYDLSCLKDSNDISSNKKKSMIVSVLTNILCVSQEAKNYALNCGFLVLIIKQLKEIYIKLSLESVECLRRISDKKRICPLLKELNELIGLLTNFMVHDNRVKCELTTFGLSDLIHKFWIWFCVQKLYIVTVLRMLCIYTKNCPIACQSLPLTSSVAGSGPRKVPSNTSLLHEIVIFIGKEMDQISKTHELITLQLCFNIVNNCCTVTECRILLCKSNLLQNISRLHPAITKKQKPWDSVEVLWLEFLQIFSAYPEGQTCIAKITDVLELVVNLTSSTRMSTKISALLVLRNIAFHSPNRARLLNSTDFVNVMKTKLENGNNEEKNIIILIMWSLAANNQKAKIIFKTLQLDVKLQQILKNYQLLSNESISSEDLKRMVYVLNIIRDNEGNR